MKHMGKRGSPQHRDQHVEQRDRHQAAGQPDLPDMPAAQRPDPLPPFVAHGGIAGQLSKARAARDPGVAAKIVSR